MLREKSQWIVAVGKHEGIIDFYDFIQTQRLLEKNKIKSLEKGLVRLVY